MRERHDCADEVGGRAGPTSLADYCPGTPSGRDGRPSARGDRGAALVEACYKAVPCAEGTRWSGSSCPACRSFFSSTASDTQLTHLSHRHRSLRRRGERTHFRIAARATRTSDESGRSQEASDFASRAREPLRQAARQLGWTLAQIRRALTPRRPDEPGTNYETFVHSAMFLDRPDPAAAWRDLGRRQAGLVGIHVPRRLDPIEADGTDLTLSVAGRAWINSDGRRNMPSARSLPAPLKNRASGPLRLAAFPSAATCPRLVGIRA